ncbi:hypothetical protein BDZ97DRAFT_1113145 [Flammula alnicola]|nr:hypothetical protein BDZ97DRAFT_1113145 [Flammula alnicola]
MAFLEPLSRLAKIEEELASIELRARNLRQDKEDLNRSIDTYRCLISPMRRLPPDILREIFISCLPDDRNPTMSNDEAPMLLSQVSSHWRSVAMTTPGLWASLHIAVPNSSPTFRSTHDSTTGDRLMVSQVTEIRSAAVKEWIARSGTLPLSIALHEWDAYPPTEYCKIFFQCILPFSKRWKNVSLTCSAASVTHFREIPPCEVPILQSLSLDITPNGIASSGTEWKDCGIFQAPCIREFSVSGIHAEISEFPLNWAQLTDLTLNNKGWSSTNLTITEITHVLERCSGLVSCRLHVGHSANPENRTEFSTISLPFLESLWIFEESQVPAFFAALDAPKLRKVEFWTSRMSVAAPSPLTQLLSNSGGSVRELSINPHLFAVHDFIECLRLCPSLTSLSLTSSSLVPPMSHDVNTPAPVSNSLLQSFGHLKADDECLCPDLEKFTCLAEAHFSDDALLEFILRKQSGEEKRIKKLKLVNVRFTRRPTVDIMPDLSTHIGRFETFYYIPSSCI